MQVKYHKFNIEPQWTLTAGLSVLDLIPLGISIIQTSSMFTIYIYLFPFVVSYHEERLDE